MFDTVKSVFIFYGILGLVQILEAGNDYHSFIMKSDDLLLQNLKKIGRNYSNCTCEVGKDNCYEFTIMVDRKVDNCSVYGFLRSENSTVPNQTIDVATATKYKLDSANIEKPDESGKGKKVAIIAISSIGGVAVTGAAGYFLSDVIRNIIQSNVYRM